MINYTVCAPADMDEMTRLLADVFSQGDPPALALGLTAAELDSFVRLYGPKALAEGLTIVARSVQTREIIGALLAEDAATPAPEGLARLSARFDPIFDILSQLDAEYRVGRTIGPGEGLHLFLLAVAPEHSGRGIAQQLVAKCIEHGANRGYQRAITEATNTRSQHVFRKLGFVERAKRSYANHRFNGRSYFESIAEQGGPMLMERLLV